MNSSRLVPLAVLISALACTPIDAADDLPKHAPGETLDFEPKLMLNDLPDSLLPSLSLADGGTTAASEADVRRLEAQVEQAKKTAATRERLFHAGVFSKVQAEQAGLTVVRLTKDLENARRDVAKEAAETQGKRRAKGEIGQEEIDKAGVALAEAEKVAKEASERWDKAQFDAAQANLHRQRLLYAVGATTKSQLRRAEERVATMKSGSQ